GTVFAAVFPRQREAIVPGQVGAPAHLGQQVLPFMARQAAAFEISARPFAPMVEEADVVVCAFERLDFALDELVQFDEVSGNFGRNFEIHSGAPVTIFSGRSAPCRNPSAGPGHRPDYANRAPPNKPLWPSVGLPAADPAPFYRWHFAIKGVIFATLFKY